jgi:hypothetical protein
VSALPANLGQEERPGGAGLIGEPRHRVEHLTDPAGVVAEEPGRPVDRLSLPDDPAAHPARPSRRSASSCGTYEVCPAASRARQSASAALSSASNDMTLEQELSVLCLRILQAALVHVSTLMVQDQGSGARGRA